MKHFLSERLIQCPSTLLSQLTAVKPVATAIVAADHPIALDSARQAFDAGVIQPVLIGGLAKISGAAEHIGWDISSFECIEANGESEAAEEGARLAHAGSVNMIMKGHIHTDAFMRPLLAKGSGIRAGRRLSHVFHMSLPDREDSLLLTDCALNVAPDIETRIAIIENAIELSQKLGCFRPRVALLAASEVVVDAMPITKECQQLTEYFAKRDIAAEVFGPLAFDNVVSETSAQLKGIDHSVAGNADIIVVPTIETGNALFKMMVYFMSACAGGIVLGGSVPVLLTSRADPAAARLASAALGAISSR